MARPKILVVAPFKTSHQIIDSIFVDCLSKSGEVTLVVPKGYLYNASVNERYELPVFIGTGSRLSARISGVTTLLWIRYKFPPKEYDFIVFLAYETIAYALAGPKGANVFLFEHNNIDSLRGSWIKHYFYRALASSVTHFVFMRYISEYIKQNYGAKAVYIPHPALDKRLTPACIHKEVRGPLVIFSPSGSTPKSAQIELRDFVSRSSGRYRAVFKWESDCRGQGWEAKPFFTDLDVRMSECDIVFLGARFENRVSAFAYESVVYGKPFVALNAPFIEALQQEYPGLFFSVRSVCDIERLNFNVKLIVDQKRRFLEVHSRSVVGARILSALHDMTT